jgi:hypothetical protein
MSFLFDKTTRETPTAPADVQGLRDVFAGNLQRYAQELFQGQVDPIIMEQISGPYRSLFAENRGRALAQAKESAGSLTGSGFANVLGETAGRSALEESAFMANLINQERARMLSTILGFSTAGIGMPQYFHQPGFLSQLVALGKGGADIYAAAQGAGGAG